MPNDLEKERKYVQSCNAAAWLVIFLQLTASSILETLFTACET